MSPWLNKQKDWDLSEGVTMISELWSEVQGVPSASGSQAAHEKSPKLGVRFVIRSGAGGCLNLAGFCGVRWVKKVAQTSSLQFQ